MELLDLDFVEFINFSYEIADKITEEYSFFGREAALKVLKESEKFITLRVKHLSESEINELSTLFNVPAMFWDHITTIGVEKKDFKNFQLHKDEVRRQIKAAISPEVNLDKPDDRYWFDFKFDEVKSIIQVLKKHHYIENKSDDGFEEIACFRQDNSPHPKNKLVWSYQYYQPAFLLVHTLADNSTAREDQLPEILGHIFKFKGNRINNHLQRFQKRNKKEYYIKKYWEFHHDLLNLPFIKN
jgi:hypothetical protein